MLSLSTLHSHPPNPFLPATFHHLPQVSPIQSFHFFSAYMKLHACVHEAPCMRAWEPCKGDSSSSFAASSTLPSPSPPFENTLPNPSATRTRWSRHCRRRTWRTLPQTARFDRGGPSRACKGCSSRLHTVTRPLQLDVFDGGGSSTTRRRGAERRQFGPASRAPDEASHLQFPRRRRLKWRGTCDWNGPKREENGLGL